MKPVREVYPIILSRLTHRFSQYNILIDDNNIPRLTDFGLCSITKNLDSVHASTPTNGCTYRYCAPELLGVIGTKEEKLARPTDKADVYSLSMVIVEARTFSESTTRPGSNDFCFQLMTGKEPFHGVSPITVASSVPKGKRPSKPGKFDAPGMTAVAWEIAQKCWHGDARKRPEVDAVLDEISRCTHITCIYLFD